jgi:large subunit ribosomal protein L22
MSEQKEVTAITRNVRMAASKGRTLARECQGKSVSEALKVVEFSPRKAAGILKQTIKSAMANATSNMHLDVDTLTVKLCVFDEGTRMRRFIAKARGSAGPIAKRLCHCKVVLAGMGE